MTAGLEAERQQREGCVQLRRCRQTGHLVGIYRAGVQYETDPQYRWTVICEEHGGCLDVETLEAARGWAADPTNWCEQCADTLAEAAR